MVGGRCLDDLNAKWADNGTRISLSNERARLMRANQRTVDDARSWTTEGGMTNSLFTTYDTILVFYIITRTVIFNLWYIIVLIGHDKKRKAIDFSDARIVARRYIDDVSSVFCYGNYPVVSNNVRMPKNAPTEMATGTLRACRDRRPSTLCTRNREIRLSKNKPHESVDIFAFAESPIIYPTEPIQERIRSRDKQS